MSHAVVSRSEWLAARTALLADEKELTRRSDELAARRSAMPWVRVEKNYRFDTANGSQSLADLFEGRSQLVVYHFMFGPDYKAGCPSCSSLADSFNGAAPHLRHHDVAFWAVSRAPLERLLDFRQRMGWSFPWASSEHSDFNADFSVFFSEDQQREGSIEYNYRREPPMPEALAGRQVRQWQAADSEGPVAQIAAMTGTDVATYARDRPGISTFVREDDTIYHAYSAYSRGLDVLWTTYQWLDRAPRGRNESGVWMRRHDEYVET